MIAGQLQTNINSMTGDRSASMAKLEGLGLALHRTPGSADEAKSLRSRMTELQKLSRTKLQKVRAKHRTVDMKVVAEQAIMEQLQI